MTYVNDLTLNIFHTFFKCFPSYFWKGKCLLRKNFKKFEINPAIIDLYKVNNRNARAMCEIYPKLAIIYQNKIHQWRRFGVFIVKFEQISHIILVFPLLALNN